MREESLSDAVSHIRKARDIVETSLRSRGGGWYLEVAFKSLNRAKISIESEMEEPIITTGGADK